MGGDHRRLCIATDTLPPVINGVNTILRVTIEELSRQGWTVFVVGPWQPAVDLLEPAPCLLRSWPAPLYPEGRFVLAGVQAVRDYLKARDVRHLHLLTPLSVGLQARLAARSLRLPVTASFLTDYVEISSYIPRTAHLARVLGWRYLRWFYRPAARVYCPERALQAELLRRGIPRAAVRLSGVDTVRFDPGKRSAAVRSRLAEAAGMVDPALICLFVGRLSPEKNVGLVLRVAELLPQALFVIVGDGPQRRDLASAAPRNVLLLGAIGDRHLEEVYPSADLFLFPSRMEAGAGAPLEAMAAGLPVIATRTAGVSGILWEGMTGFFFDGDDAAGSAEILKGLSADRRRLLKMGGHARRLALERRWPAVLAPWSAEIERLTLETQET